MRNKPNADDYKDVVLETYPYRGLSMTPLELLKLRTSLSYAPTKRILIKDYSIVNDILDHYPAIKLVLQRRGYTTGLQFRLEKLLFGCTEFTIRLKDFKALIELGRGERTERDAILHIQG